MQPANAATNPAAGWFADPHVPNAMRWWDGFAWTHHVHPAAPVAAPSPATHVTAATPIASHHAYAPQHNADAPQHAATAMPAAAQHGGMTLAAAAAEPSLFEANPKSTTAIGFSLGYLALAITMGVYVAGIVPALYTFKAFGRGEKLAPVALLTAVAAIGFALMHMQAR